MQEDDGGWGESINSCVEKRYVKNKNGSQVVMASWATMGLLLSSELLPESIEMAERGVKLLMNRQLENGDWPQEDVTGVFNKTCAISYTNYRNIFPLWALGMYSRML